MDIKELKLKAKEIKNKNGRDIKHKNEGTIPNLVLDLSVGCGIGVWLGYKLDQYFLTLPLFLFIFSLVGMAGGWYSFYKDIYKDKGKNERTKL